MKVTTIAVDLAKNVFEIAISGEDARSDGGVFSCYLIKSGSHSTIGGNAIMIAITTMFSPTNGRAAR